MNKLKVILVIAFKNFQDEEYFVVKEELEKKGIKTMTASSKIGQAVGINGGTTVASKELTNIKPRDYDGLVFIGGPGVLKDLDNKHSYDIINKAFLSRKLIAAICIAPLLLARAGILKGKKATVWVSSMNKMAMRAIKGKGAIYLNRPVVQDENIITGNGSSAAVKFAQAVVLFLTKS